MKIEKINDNQIRFILTSEDLAARQIRLSELAYGTDKAKELFRDMMQQASSEYGFEFSGTPLMIEAIPMRSGCIVLIVTRVENPEELDPRFANFSPAVQNAAQKDGTLSSLEQLLNSLHSPQEEDSDGSHRSRQAEVPDQQEAMRQFRDFALCNRLYIFSSMDCVIDACAALGKDFPGESILFRDNRIYYLLLKMNSIEEAAALRAPLEQLTEYGNPVPVTSGRQPFLSEHECVLIEDHAVQRLASFRRS